MRLKKIGVIFLVFSIIFIRISIEIRTNPVNATLTYETDFNQGTWVNRSGGNTTSTTGSPFTVSTNNVDFLLSYGTRDGSNNVYFGSLNNNNASSYFRLDSNHLIVEARTLLAPFNPLGSDPYEMVIAMKTIFYYVSITSMTLTWESIGAQAFTGKVIYSLDQGLTWQAFGDGFSLSSSTSPKSLTTWVNSSYSGIQLGYYFSVSNLTSTFNVKNPVISIAYSQLSDEDAANALKEEVILYTPCVSDENGLTFITAAKKTEFMEKYGALNANAKSIFSGLSIGGGFTALDRYLFLI